MMSYRIRFVAATVIPLTGLLAGTSLASPAGAGVPAAAASVAASVDLAQWPGRLNSVSTVSATKAWAVGTHGSTGFLLFWNGSRWQQSCLVLPGRDSELTAVDARIANDIWAVGDYFPDSSSHQVTLIEHWDGTSWHREPAPGPIRYLTSVSADSPDDAWAAGFGARGAVLLHWDGQRWTSELNKYCGFCTITGLRGVTAISPDDAWAVGYTFGGSSTFKTMHWDGVSWKVVSSALPGGRKLEGSLESVSATSGTDVWAVGNYITEDVSFRSFIEHWDGRRWTRAPNPTQHEPGAGILYGVSAVEGAEAWTAGYRLRPSRTLTYHWDGDRWSEVESPDPGLFFAVDASSTTNAWAVGSRGGSTLIEHWDGHIWSVS